MPTKTRRQLVDEALSNLGVLAAGQTASDEDVALVDAQIGPFVAQLTKDQIVYIGNPEEIDEEIFIPLGRLLANVCGPKYGSAINREAKFADEAELRRINATRPTYETLRAMYF